MGVLRRALRSARAAEYTSIWLSYNCISLWSLSASSSTEHALTALRSWASQATLLQDYQSTVQVRRASTSSSL